MVERGLTGAAEPLADDILEAGAAPFFPLVADFGVSVDFSFSAISLFVRTLYWDSLGANCVLFC